MKVAIVGHAFDKFDTKTSYLAIKNIEEIISKHNPDLVISGDCPIGGIDVWAEMISNDYGNPFRSYSPDVKQWNPFGQYGFKKRNLDIAKNCDVLYNIVVRDWPKDFTGDKYKDYHCLKHEEMKDHPHVKSGGCWTAWKAKELGKEVHWIIIDAEEVIV